MPVRLKASDLARTLTSKERFVPLLDRSIAKHDFEWNFEYTKKGHDDAWHPSGDCTPSLADLYHIAHDRQDEDSRPNPPGLTLRKTFMVGHFWHQWLQFHAVKAGICDSKAIEVGAAEYWGEPIQKIRKEDIYYGRGPENWYSSSSKDFVTNTVKKYPKTSSHIVQPKPFHWTAGSADIAPAYLGEEQWVIDFKTMNPTDFKASNPPERFAAKWECQMNIYMDFFDIDKTCIIAIDKLTGEMKEFVYYRNGELIDAIYRKWKLVSECLEKDIEPPVDEEFALPLKGVSE